ncbi:Na/Pi cotransporter family protein [Paenibacillus protaetiae]|uniref:Na/Pi cotransporter family protein n=1 Tax=Paenibacillus protaetiae TaxID=2509456 RepID=A0A4P6EUZ0_9BACL|nr:Na/Pi symporter [Paenibacillus protaetiae]QAY66315.1 Na/Pi cotransporter family protein [Paenibacillus protaetiae]
MFIAILLPMAFGFSIFMSGMKLMELALHRLAGSHLQRALHTFTSTPLHGLVTGIAASAFLQSSTAVTVITIGLVNAGLLSFPRTLGIVLGTNIGTCLTTELIGLHLTKLAMPILYVSLAMWLITAVFDEMNLLPGLQKRGWLPKLRASALAAGGFGLLLAGLAVMQSIGPAIQQSPLFRWFLAHASDNLWWGLLAGAVLTAAVHSSTAVIGLVMGFAMLGSMSIDIGTAIVLGANIGTCVTALLASIGGSKAGRFVALSHIVLNAGGALMFMPLVSLLASAAGIAASSPASQIAHAQTLFNIVCSLLALPLCYVPYMKKLGR